MANARESKLDYIVITGASGLAKESKLDYIIIANNTVPPPPPPPFLMQQSTIFTGHKNAT